MDDSYKCNTDFKNANPRLHIACLTWDYLKSVYVGGGVHREQWEEHRIHCFQAPAD